MLFNVPPWLRRLIGLYNQVPVELRYGAAALALVALGAVLL